MEDTLKGKVAVVTGAGSGIGEATARYLSMAGANVALVDVKKESIRQISSELGNALAVGADVSDEHSMASAYAKILAGFGRLDIVVANAGINGFWGPLDEFPTEEWDRVINVNLRGTFLTTKLAVPHLKRDGGSVIITASVNGTRMFSNTGATAYACSKAAQVAFAKMTALELAKHKIRVNVICPGSVETHIADSTKLVDLEKIREPVEFPAGVVPLTHGKAAQPEEVAKMVWFLASPLSEHISGTEVFIDGAQSLLQG